MDEEVNMKENRVSILQSKHFRALNSLRICKPPLGSCLSIWAGAPKKTIILKNQQMERPCVKKSSG
jgi:hypothetical protein